MQDNNQVKLKDTIEKAIRNDKKIGSLKDNLFYIPISHIPGRFVNSLIIMGGISSVLFFLEGVDKKTDVYSLYISGILFLSIFLISIIDLLVNYDYLVFDLDNLTFYKSSFFLNLIKYSESEKILSHDINNIKIEIKSFDTRGGIRYFDYVSFVIEDNVEMIESLAFSLNNHYLLTERYRLLANSLGIEVNFIGDIEKIQNEIQKRESAAKIESIITIIVITTFFVSIMLYFGKL